MGKLIAAMASSHAYTFLEPKVWDDRRGQTRSHYKHRFGVEPPDQPQVAEVRLTVQANSRNDITLTPEILAFGQVSPGSEAKAIVTVSMPDNPGTSVDVKSDSAFVHQLHI